MRPIKLKIKGLNSFVEEQTIDFEKLTEQGFFGIFGPTGSGKSTILDGYKLRYNNPYDKLIKKNIAITTNIVKKSAGRYCQSKFENSKLAKSKLYKILKAV